MAISKHVWKVLDEQEKLVLSLDDPKITEAAKKLAFYDAMFEAAEDDPLDDPDDADHMLQYLEDLRDELLTTYMDLINKAL